MPTSPCETSFFAAVENAILYHLEVQHLCGGRFTHQARAEVCRCGPLGAGLVRADPALQHLRERGLGRRHAGVELLRVLAHLLELVRVLRLYLEKHGERVRHYIEGIRNVFETIYCV